MDTVLGLNSDQIGKIGIGAIVAVAVVGLLISMIISAIVGRLIVLVVVVGLAVFIWQQRATVEHDAKTCHLQMSFFGYHVSAPADVVERCQQLKGK